MDPILRKIAFLFFLVLSTSQPVGYREHLHISRANYYHIFPTSSDPKNLFGIPLCLEDSLDPTLHSSLPERRSRNGVALQYRPVNGDGNALAGGRVQFGRFDTSGLGSALSTDLEVDAVGVVLSTVGLVGGVEGNDLMAEDVRARNQGRRNCDSPGVVVCNEGIRGPRAAIVVSLKKQR